MSQIDQPSGVSLRPENDETYEDLEHRAYELYDQLDPQQQLILLEEWLGSCPDECPNYECRPVWNHWNYNSIYDDRPALWVIHSCHTEPELCAKWSRLHWCQCGYTTCSKCEMAEKELFPKNKNYLNEQYYYNFGYWQLPTPTKEQIEEMKSVIMIWTAEELYRHFWSEYDISYGEEE